MLRDVSSDPVPHADGSCVDRVFSAVRFSDSADDISETVATRITERNVQLFHHES